MGRHFQSYRQCADAHADNLHAPGLWSCHEERQRIDTAHGDFFSVVLLWNNGIRGVAPVSPFSAGWCQA